jgi:hypothetical protein
MSVKPYQIEVSDGAAPTAPRKLKSWKQEPFSPRVHKDNDRPEGSPAPITSGLLRSRNGGDSSAPLSRLETARL